MRYSEEQELHYPDMDSIHGSDLTIYLIGREQVRPGVSCNRVLRKHYIFHFITRGKGVFRQGTDTYSVEKGQVFLITPDIFCSYTADEKEPYSYIWVEFDGPAVKDYLNKCGISPCSPIYTGIDLTCIEYLETMIDCHSYNLRVQAYFLLALDKMIQNCPEDKRPSSESAEPPSEMYIRHATKYISLNYWKNPSVQELADFCGIDRSHLSRLFKQKINQSPQEYIVHYRINIACSLLKTTSLSLLQIASALGYSDQFTFSKAFKKEKGMSPSVWRQQYA